MDKHRTCTIIAWSFYDWANSAFTTIITTFIFAAYFTQTVAENKIIGTEHWGFAISIAGVIIAIISPIVGAIADYGGHRKRWLFAFTSIAVICAALLWFVQPSTQYVTLALTCIIIGTVGYETGMVFYNSFLVDIAPKSFLGRVSGWAWGFGYFGGIACLTVALYGFVQNTPSWLNTDTYENIRITGPLVAVWFTLFALPLFIWVPENNRSTKKIGASIQHGLHDLKITLFLLLKEKNILRFLIARMLYIDGLNTVFIFGGIYAAGTFGMSFDEVIKFGITLNITAGIGAILFAWMDDYIGPKPTILMSLIGLLLLGFILAIVETKTAFWITGLCLAMFVGPVQSASRSLLINIVPEEKVTQMFGFYALSGKATTFLGPLAFGLATAHYGSQRYGVIATLSFFILGALILLKVKSRRTD